MIQLPEGFDSVFRYIVVVSQRAEQLINGAKPRSESQRGKKTLVARDDVDEKLVSWRILTQEELDAQRQAIVEQFRAEVDSVTDLQATPAYEDVLPTSAEETPAAEEPAVEQDEERDDEVSRLQKLLGMVGGAAGIGAPAESEDKEKVEADAGTEDEAEAEVEEEVEKVEEVSLELADVDGKKREDEEEDEEG